MADLKRPRRCFPTPAGHRCPLFRRRILTTGSVKVKKCARRGDVTQGAPLLPGGLCSPRGKHDAKAPQDFLSLVNMERFFRITVRQMISKAGMSERLIIRSLYFFRGAERFNPLSERLLWIAMKQFPFASVETGQRPPNRKHPAESLEHRAGLSCCLGE